MSDGSIRIDTKVDSANAEKNLNSLGQKIENVLNRMQRVGKSTNVFSNMTQTSKQLESSIKSVDKAIDGYTAKLNQAKSGMKTYNEEMAKIKANTEVDLTKSSTDEQASNVLELERMQIEKLNKEWQDTIDKVNTYTKKIEEAKYEKSNLASELVRVKAEESKIQSKQNATALKQKKITQRVKETGSALKHNSKSQGGFNSAVTLGIKKLAKMALAIFGIRSAYRILSQAGSAWLGEQEELSAKIQGLWASLGAFLEPVIRGIVSALTVAISYLNAFVKLLTGIDVIAKRNANAISKQAKETNALKKSTTAFDEMNILPDTSSSSSPSTAIDLADVDTTKMEEGLNRVYGILEKVKSFLSQLKLPFEEWANTDLSELGESLETNFETVFTGLFETLGMVIPGLISTYISPAFETFTTVILPIITQFTTQVVRTCTTLFTTINNLFQKIWPSIEKGLALLVKIWQSAWNSIEKAWNKWGEPIFENLREAITNVGEIWESVWDNFLEPIFNNFMETVDWLWEGHLSPLLDNFLDFVGELINGALEIYNKFIVPIVKWLVEYLGPIVSNVINTISNIIGTLIGVVADVANGIITTLKGIVQFVVGVFTGDWNKAWTGIKNIFKGIWDAIAGVAKGAVNLVIDCINGMIASAERSINNIVGMVNRLKISNPFNGDIIWSPSVNTVSFSKIPKLASGGIVNRPTQTIIGEAGKEGVLPLTNRSAMEELGAIIGQYVNGGGPITIPIQLGSKTIAKYIIDLQNQKAFATNGGAY